MNFRQSATKNNTDAMLAALSFRARSLSRRANFRAKFSSRYARAVSASNVRHDRVAAYVRATRPVQEISASGDDGVAPRAAKRPRIDEQDVEREAEEEILVEQDNHDAEPQRQEQVDNNKSTNSNMLDVWNEFYNGVEGNNNTNESTIRREQELQVEAGIETERRIRMMVDIHDTKPSSSIPTLPPSKQLTLHALDSQQKLIKLYAPKLSDYLDDGGTLKYQPRPEWYLPCLQGKKRRRDEIEAAIQMVQQLSSSQQNEEDLELLETDILQEEAFMEHHPPPARSSPSSAQDRRNHRHHFSSEGIGQPNNVFGKDQESALHVSIRVGAIEAASELIRLGAPVSAVNLKKVTPLILASQKGLFTIVTNLLERGADPCVLSVSGSNALLQACHFGHLHIAKLLIAKGATIEMANFKNTTPLMRASQEGHIQVVRLLIENGANVNRRNNEQMSALMLASQRGHAPIVQMLIDAGADVNAMTAQKSTSLLLACKREHTEVVTVLVRSACELFHRDTRGRTARDIAEKKKSKPIIRLLDPAKQVQLIQFKVRVERNYVMKLMWNLLQNERAFVELSITRDRNSIHNLPDDSSHFLLGLSRSQRALMRAMALPEPLLENIASFMPLPNIWDERLTLLTSRCSVDPNASIFSCFDLMDEVLEEAGFLDACDQAGVVAPPHFSDWESWRIAGHRHNHLPPTLSKLTQRSAVTSTLVGLPASGLQCTKEERFPLKPGRCSIDMRREICFLQLLAHPTSKLRHILSRPPYRMPPWIMEQLITVNDIQSLSRRMTGHGLKFEASVAVEIVMLASSLVSWYMRERAADDKLPIRGAITATASVASASSNNSSEPNVMPV
mmetsp:Transcript_6360/g.9164  ORF Transcript_6360/g.9164 Transcript_6360/m.9164 type:complete len:847 (-) Transcript_6360:244-2784(-)|eukprot:CAMPEP_0202444532 /NCGR_PEP_ID=MMETSP1360-20130828/3572_1 /ASSEMBLY_ACC=CAM_ASM_000848 /TAXON_ID=515479 /ORGANISM="Licmophora paradoxa, Strain CCMP2313" /LENGTH=846 /DNA_ID=CAMNT_0049060549 /DNA_START=182 /DNA_END=2722 /DNA_ORIENTATION=-